MISRLLLFEEINNKVNIGPITISIVAMSRRANQVPSNVKNGDGNHLSTHKSVISEAIKILANKCLKKYLRFNESIINI